jgi:hypothetical protein
LKGAATETDFAGFFKENSKARLSGQVTNVRSVTPDVTSVEGSATVVFSDAEPSQTVYTAVFVRNGEEWLIDSVHETDVPTPQSPADALKDLEFLIGRWVDASDDVRVETTVAGLRQKHFSCDRFPFKVPMARKAGTQIIGWDPRAQQIRSWSFDSDGSFGEGIWSKSGEDWLVKSTQTTADGDAASGTYVFSRVDDNTITVKLVGYEVEGEPRPSSDPVRVVRVQAQAETGQQGSSVGGEK